MPDMLPTTWDLIRGGLLSTPKITGRRGIRRWLLTAGILLVLIPMGWFHRFCLALDHLLFPSFKAIEPKKPLFIIGPPRSGTTYLHRLIEKNPQFTTFYFWELLLAPAICQKRFWLGLYACDSRIGHPGLRCLRFIEQHCFSSMDDIHATSLMDAEEDYFGLLPLHACFLLIVAFPDCEKLWKLPQFDQWESSEDRDTVMNFYRGLLQRHLHVRGHERTLVSKNPSFCGMLASLHDHFPTARFAIPIRTPEETIPSLLSSMRGGPELLGYPAATLEPLLKEMMHRYYQHIGNQLTLLGEQAAVVPYRDLVGNPHTALTSLANQLGYDEATLTAGMEPAPSTPAKKYRSGHRYTLEQFGLNQSTLRSEYSWLYDDSRMGLQVSCESGVTTSAISDSSLAPGVQSSC